MAGLTEVVRHPGWVDAFTTVRAGLEARRPVVLAGEPGLGKSLLLRDLQRVLQDEDQVVILIPGGDRSQDRSPDVVLLDDADRVPPALLKHLIGSAPRCVLAGPRALVDTLEGLAASPVLVEMRPLSNDEVWPYLRDQVQRAGLPDTLLGPGTFDALAQGGAGNPRRLQKLASRALFHAWIDNADQVSTAHVAGAVAQDASARQSDPHGLFPEAGDGPPDNGVQTLPPAPLPARSPLVAHGVTLERNGTLPARLRVRAWIHALGAAVSCLAVLAAFAWYGEGPARNAASPLPRVGATQAASSGPQVALSLPAPEPGPAAAPPAPEVQAGGGPAHPEPPPPATLPDLAVAPLQPQSPEPAASPRAAPLQRSGPPASPPSAHVFVAFPPSDPAAGRRGATLVGALKDAGMDAVLVDGPAAEQNTGVRYFFAADQAAAAQVVRQMGDVDQERLAAVRGTPPRPGTIHVMIPSRSSGGRSSLPQDVTRKKEMP